MPLSTLPARLKGGPIRVFLVDDSAVALVLLKRMIETSSDIQVVGTARNGREALAAFERTQPDVICTDYHMPDIDGLALIQEAMVNFPRPILVISSTINPEEREKAFPLLAAGAVDVFAKPNASTNFAEAAQELVRKIKMVSGVLVIARRFPLAPRSVPLPPAPSSASRPPVLRPVKLVAIGASTGGPQVLQAIFNGLPANFPAPIVCVQHISAGFLEGLVTWLDGSCRLRVKIAAPREIAVPGTIYFPQENTHLEINAQGQFSASSAPNVDGHRPSVTATFESVARSYGRNALAILLTGMGSDGATGLQSVSKVGGLTIAQDEASCVVFGMPKQAIALGAAQWILPPTEIIQALNRLAV